MTDDEIERAMLGVWQDVPGAVNFGIAKPMTDRELLELAARAAEIEIMNAEFSVGPHYKGTTRRWNPLGDDGDALRLAVKLCLTVQVDDEDHRTYVVGSTGRCIGTEPHGDDLYAATRRAIVRAAAEIGRGME